MAEATTETMLDRARGALIGGALGDALGMPTQLLTASEIRRDYGYVESFLPPHPDHPVSKGLQAGTITDDTEQTLLLAQVLVASHGGFDQKKWVNALVAWERDVKARGGYDLLGPSTKRAIDLINSGVDPRVAGAGGSTNGAAMRIAPVGIAFPPAPLERFVARVADTTAATHGSPIAISAASAVAAAVSTGVGGGSWIEASRTGVEAARFAQHGSDIDMAGLIERACAAVRGKGEEQAVDAILATAGTSVASEESIPAAFAVLEAVKGDPWRAAVLSANLGGDTDTIGAISAGMAGACAGHSRLPAARIAELRGLDLEEVGRLARRLVEMRLEATST